MESNWTVISEETVRKKSTYYLWCQCSCGFIGLIQYSSLKSGRSTQCRACSYTKGFKKSLDNVPAWKRVHKDYTQNAKNRGLEFSLSLEEVITICSKNCHYCGSKPGNYTKGCGRETGISYSGIDRKNNLQGYNVNNCVPCCKICNRAKRDMSETAWHNWLRNLASFLNR